MKNPQLRLILQLIALVLCAGIVGGYVGYRLGRSQTPPPIAPANYTTDDIMSGLSNELILTPEQAISIRPLIERRQQLLTSGLPVMPEDIREIQANIREQLNPQQQQIFDERTERARSRARQNRPPRPIR